MKNVVRIHTEKTEDASMESYKLTLGYKTSVTSKASYLCFTAEVSK